MTSNVGRLPILRLAGIRPLIRWEWSLNQSDTNGGWTTEHSIHAITHVHTVLGKLSCLPWSPSRETTSTFPAVRVVLASYGQRCVQHSSRLSVVHREGYRIPSSDAATSVSSGLNAIFSGNGHFESTSKNKIRHFARNGLDRTDARGWGGPYESLQ